MATLATQQVTRTGLSPSFAAATSGGDKMATGDHKYLHVKNASGGSITVTIATPGTVDGQAIADLAVAVPASGERMIGPITDKLFRDPTTGLAAITYSAVTTVTVASISA